MDRLERESWRRPLWGGPSLGICAGAFLMGAALGWLYSGNVAGDALGGFILRYTAPVAAGEVTALSLLRAAAAGLSYHLLAFLAGFSVLGVAAAPLVAAARGVSLAFSVAAVAGASGRGMAAALFFPGALLTVPCLLLLTAQALAASYALARRALGVGTCSGNLYPREYFARCALCAIVLGLSALLETCLTVRLVRLAAQWAA